MMMQRAALAFLLLLATASGVSSQMGVSGGGPSSFSVEATAPANPVNGQLWLRKSDLRTFVYSDSLHKWLGELQVIHFNRNAVNATGQLRNGETPTQNSSAPFQGFDVGTDSLRIMEIRGHSNDAATTAACTTFVWADDSSALKVIWDANEELWLPGGSGWVSTQGGAPRYAIPPGTTLGVTIGGGGAVLPDNPNVWLFCRREVAP